MAATADERREAKGWFEREGARSGSAFEEIYKPGMRAQWERPDGVVVTLPSDPYHFRLYMNRGFKLAPPAAPGGLANGSSTPVAEVAPVAPTEDVAPPLGRFHKHRFDGDKVGAPCKTPHCSAARRKKKRSF